MEKTLILRVHRRYLMGWYVRIKDEWNRWGPLTQIAWIFAVVWPIVTAIKDGLKMPTYDIYSILNFILYILLVAVIIQNRGLVKKLENKELEKLIKPLYLAFDKYPEDAKIMQHEKFGLPMTLSLLTYPGPKTEKAGPMIDILKQHGNLAQLPMLQELIKQFLDFTQVQREKGISMGDPYFIDMVDKVDQIKDLATARYNELMWGKKKS